MQLSRVDWVPLMAIVGGGTVGAFALGSMMLESSGDVVIVHEVTVEAPTPTAGSPMRLRVAPFGSNAGPEPLIYVDGVRIQGRDGLNLIDPNTIDRIEVVKGGAARELFGDEAVGGVIQIYLKATR